MLNACENTVDVPMTRVKMNAKHEYEFIANFKVMQNIFKTKRLEKARSCPFDSSPPSSVQPLSYTAFSWEIQPIPVEKLVKCKMQYATIYLPFVSATRAHSCGRDNLEFLQWMKRFWDTNYPGHAYDPVARRRGQATDTPSTLAPIATTRTTNTPGAGSGRSGGKTPISGHRAGSASAVNHEQVLGLQAQLKEMSTHLEGLEKERDFYFAKVCLTALYFCVCSERLAAAGYRDPSAATDGRASKGKP